MKGGSELHAKRTRILRARLKEVKSDLGKMAWRVGSSLKHWNTQRILWWRCKMEGCKGERVWGRRECDDTINTASTRKGELDKGGGVSTM